MLLCGAVLAAACSLAPATARAELAPLSTTEQGQLLHYELVPRPLQLELRGNSYTGGISYLVLKARPEAVLTALEDVAVLPQLLPRTKAARLIDIVDGRARVELVQGTGPFEATYTVVIERMPGRGELRFWLDPSRPHGIRDVFGFFRVEARGPRESLVTIAAAVDLGAGLLGFFFEDAVRRAVLGTPRHIRDFVEAQVPASRR